MKDSKFIKTLLYWLLIIICVLAVRFLCGCKTTKDIQVSEDSVKVSYLDKIEIRDFWENLSNRVYNSVDSFTMDIEYPQDSTKPKVHIKGKGLKSSKENNVIKSTEETQKVTRNDSIDTQKKENNKIRKEPKYIDSDIKKIVTVFLIFFILVIVVWLKLKD